MKMLLPLGLVCLFQARRLANYLDDGVCSTDLDYLSEYSADALIDNCSRPLQATGNSA